MGAPKPPPAAEKGVALIRLAQHRCPGRTLDTDDVGAEIGEDHRGMRPWPDRGKFNDPQARQGAAWS